MYNHYLDTFIEVADCGSFSKASKKLFLSIPAIKKQIDSLESMYNLKLFDRSYKGLILTDEGKTIYKYAKEIIDKSNSILSNMHKVINNKILIRVGVYYKEDAKYLLNIWNNNQALKNKYDIEIINCKHKITTKVNFKKLKIDILFYYYDYYSIINAFNFTKVIDINPIISVPKNSKVYNKKTIKLKDLYNENIVLLKKGVSKYTDEIRKEISSSRLNIKIFDIENNNSHKIFTSNKSNNNFILLSDYWGNIDPSYNSIEFDTKNKISLGFIYPKQINKTIKIFINDVAKEFKKGR